MTDSERYYLGCAESLGLPDGAVLTGAMLARAAGVSVEHGQRWKSRLRRRGLFRWADAPPGPPPRVDASAVLDAVDRGEGIPAVARRLGVHRGTAWRVARAERLARGGILMARRATRTAEPVDLEPTGTVIAEGVVPGRAVSWKAPATSRAGRTIMRDTGDNQSLNRKVRSYKSFVCWVQFVQLHLRAINRRRHPYGGAVELRATFYFRPMSNDRQVPDLCNAVKAFEDAMQGVVIKNDNQVMRHRTERVMSAQEPERVEFQVIAL